MHIISPKYLIEVVRIFNGTSVGMGNLMVSHELLARDSEAAPDRTVLRSAIYPPCVSIYVEPFAGLIHIFAVVLLMV